MENQTEVSNQCEGLEKGGEIYIRRWQKTQGIKDIEVEIWFYQMKIDFARIAYITRGGINVEINESNDDSIEIKYYDSKDERSYDLTIPERLWDKFMEMQGHGYLKRICETYAKLFPSSNPREIAAKEIVSNLLSYLKSVLEHRYDDVLDKMIDAIHDKNSVDDYCELNTIEVQENET